MIIKPVSQQFELLEDDGTAMHPKKQKLVNDMVTTIKESKFLGQNSPINDKVALRVVETMLDNYQVYMVTGRTQPSSKKQFGKTRPVRSRK